MIKALALFTLALLFQAAQAQKVSDITFYNGKTKLAGSLFIPAGAGKHPAIAVTHGSGKEGKSQAGYISLANILAKAGFIVLIYDKRGVGGSDGQYVEVPDMNIPAGDLVQAVRYLQTRAEVDKTRIGVYGHSQGGWVAPLAAIVNEDISFVVVACGGGVSIREQDLYSYRAQLKAKGYAAERVDSAITFGRTLFTYLGSGIGYTVANAAYVQAAEQPWFDFFKQMGFTSQLPPPSMLKEPVFSFFKAINYDPQSALRALNVPCLLILAGSDETVPSEKCKQLWEDAFYAGGHPGKLSVVALRGENHYDFENVNGVVRYKKTFGDAMVKWLNEKIKGAN